MRFIHLSDLHIGKSVNGYSMLDDQRKILTQIINIIDNEKVDSVIIAGDIYDKVIPPAEAVKVFDDFLCRLAKRNLEVFIISGNHDSAERLSFASSLIDGSGVHISRVYNGEVTQYKLKDKFGEINVYLLPFIKPINVKSAFNIDEIPSYNEAVKYAIDEMKVNNKERNILVTHQFVTGGQKCDSEEISIGGTDNVDAQVFDDFDYVALGHLHGPQNISRETIRYSGTPLKYSFSEVSHEKSVTIIDFNEKNNINIRTIPLIPDLDLREIKGKYNDIVLKKNYENTNTKDYVRIVLTDEEDIYDVMNKLRTVYPNIMEVNYDNKRTRSNSDLNIITEIENKSEEELFAEFYRMQNDSELSKEQVKIINSIFEQIKEDKDETN